jgi:spermidine/putrescine transport system ATP-binding protein
MVTIFLELAPGTEFRIQKQQHELEALDLSIGSILTARWVKDHSFVLSQTDDG